tara:strand:+ start:150 stop:305 length:156 start_codon:yes stop_codon:yes gene_type:complete
VYSTLEEVLVRTGEQQKNKIKTSIAPKIERTLRSAKNPTVEIIGPFGKNKK